MKNRKNMKVLLIILIILMAAAGLYLLLLLPGKPMKDAALFTDYAHRGLYGGDIPENSLAAFIAAADAGYGIELDLQLSSDGEVMVFHDYDLERMTGSPGLLSERTCGELSALRLRTPDGRETDEGIPTLRAVLDEAGGRVPFLLELKGESGDTALCEAIHKVLEGYEGQFAVQSFNPLLLRGFAKVNPLMPRGLLYTDVFRVRGRSGVNFLLSAMAFNRLCRPNFISCDKDCLDMPTVKAVTGLYGLPVFVWTLKGDETAPPGTHAIFEKDVS